MKKENVFARITSKEQAEQAKSILEGLGEKVSKHFYDGYEKCLWFRNCTWVTCKDDGNWDGYTELSLKQLIELILKEEERKPLLVSEDGVNLFEGDDYWVPQFVLFSSPIDYYPMPYKFTINSNNRSSEVIFSTKQAALDWIEKQKPKSIKLYFCDVTKNQITFNEPTGFITALELDMINEVIKKLS